ncbi:unnamed protein product [Gordionus sp. m RMFG-2023]
MNKLFGLDNAMIYVLAICAIIWTFNGAMGINIHERPIDDYYLRPHKTSMAIPAIIRDKRCTKLNRLAH